MKKFLILGSNIGQHKKVVFALIMKNKISVGYIYDKSLEFACEPGTKTATVGWYTSLPVQRRVMLELTKTYNAVDDRKYDNYDAMEVSKTKNIPMDYTGKMGVPVHFLDKYNPEQFEIICLIRPVINGKGKFARLIIRNKHPVSTENTVNNNVDELTSTINRG